MEHSGTTATENNNALSYGRHPPSYTELGGNERSRSRKDGSGNYAEACSVEKQYHWNEFRSSVFCSPFGFVLQLVLIACCGSFLFGFNISLLNTALDAIESEFLSCGRAGPTSELVYVILRNSKDPLRDCQVSLICSFCIKTSNGKDRYIDCGDPGGYTNVKCKAADWHKAFLSCAVLIGGALGAVTGGRFMGYGRRTLLMIDMMIFTIGVIGSMCSNSISSMMFARLVVGYGVGLASVCSPTYMSEMTPRAKRGRYGVFHQLSITLGILAGIILGIPLVDPSVQDVWWEPSTFQRFWWRFMLGLGLVPVIIGLYFFGFVYTFETPVYYVEQRRYQDAAYILDKINDGENVKSELDVCISNVRLGEEMKDKGLTFLSAFKNPEYRLVILIGLALAGFQQFGGINVFVTSSSNIFAKAGLSAQMRSLMSTLMAVINVLMTFPTIFLIERLGRKTLLFVGSAMQSICIIPAAIAYWVDQSKDTPSTITAILAVIGVLGFVMFFAVAFGPIVWVYLFEIYPMEIKDVAASVATSFNWISGILMVFLANVLTNEISFTLFSILQVLGTLFVLFFMRETKGLPLGISPYITQKGANKTEP